VEALDMVIDEVDLDLEPNYGIQVAADRVAWQQDMRIAAAELRRAEAVRDAQRSLMVAIPLSPPTAAACAAAFIVAANRLDHYSGVVSESAKGEIRAALVSQACHEPTLELVERRFPWVRDDAAWARDEALRLRLHAHELMLHDSDNERQQ
jgi:hypothetical protein